MENGELKNRIDSLWQIFWTGGLTNPLDIIEQITAGAECIGKLSLGALQNSVILGRIPCGGSLCGFRHGSIRNCSRCSGALEGGGLLCFLVACLRKEL